MTSEVSALVAQKHPIEDFWARLCDFDAYPPDVSAVAEQLPGTAAFAASAGFYRPAGSHQLPPFPYSGLMIVGHNLDSRTGYEERRRSGRSHGDLVPGPAMSTWLGLYKLLDLAGVARHEFFFTNIYVGLKEGTPTGRFSAYPAREFRRWCSEFLRHQVVTMRPRVVLLLGVQACRDIARVTSPAPWPEGALPPPQVVPTRFFGYDTLMVPAHHTSFQKRIAADAEALGAAWQAGRAAGS